MYRTKTTPDPVFTDVLKLELGDGRAVARRTEASAGPRAARGTSKNGFVHRSLDKEFSKGSDDGKRVPVRRAATRLGHGDVVIAAITSCTNTSNPSVMVAPACSHEGGGERA